MTTKLSISSFLMAASLRETGILPSHLLAARAVAFKISGAVSRDGKQRALPRITRISNPNPGVSLLEFDLRMCSRDRDCGRRTLATTSDNIAWRGFMSGFAFRIFQEKCVKVVTAHELDVPEDMFRFSGEAVAASANGDWNLCAKELTTVLETILAPYLAPWHAFVDAPYVREIGLPDGTRLRLAIINQQSKEWYGADSFLASCDFLVAKKRGCFDGAFRFVDLGGHQMIWATYYALTSRFASVISYEPSLLNCLIGLFNCLANDVIDQVEVLPFAVAARSATSSAGEGEKMLIDFMTIPLRTITLAETIDSPKDFVKTDIEGYEYEMLADPDYVALLQNTPWSHFELHLGHLIKRGISREAGVQAMKEAKLEGTELYSGKDMYEYLRDCDRESYPAFILKA